MRDRQLRKLAAVPLLLTVLLYVVLLVLAVFLADDAVGLLWVKPTAGWFMLGLWYIAAVAVFVCLLVVLALLFTTIAEAIGGPFYDKMATRILAEHGISFREPGFFEGTVPDIVRSLLFVIPGVICSLFGLIPFVGWPFAAVGVVVAALGFASAAINPALLVTGHGMWSRVGYVFRSFSAMVGMGAMIAAALLLLPLVGLIAIPASIVGATEIYAKSVAGRQSSGGTVVTE